MPEINLLWKGRIPLDKIDWELDPNREFTLSTDLETKREEIWQKTVTGYPNSYDGSLLVLDKFNINSQTAFLSMGFITFSRILTLEKFDLEFHKYGCIGMQALIFSPEKTHILIGQRSKELMYRPLSYGGPGGMLETADAELPFQDASMREIMEEAELDFRSDRFLVAIMKDLYTKVGVCFLVECIVAGQFDPHIPVAGNEEWTDNQLQWYPIEELVNLDPTLCLESPIFVRNEYLQY